MQVSHATSPELVFRPATLQASGWYICRVHHGANFTFSRWAQLHVTRATSPKTVSSRFGSFIDGLCILRQPQSCILVEGDPMELTCVAVATPPPRYQWFRNEMLIPGANYSCLQVNMVTTAERGMYRCKVYNLFREAWSTEAQVEIGPRLFTMGIARREAMNAESALLHGVATRNLYATDKVALLIGNMTYRNHKELKAPMVDVHELTNLLRQLDFKVVSLLDLSKEEMQAAVSEFLLLLDKGVYGLLYYAGHGYENFGNSFMVPIDAPRSYTSEHCLCVQSVLQRMQERQTGLNVFLLDMCRKRNMNDDIIPKVGALKVTANIVFGYATCADAEAYEINQGGLSNGIFISFLKKWLLEDEKITVLLDKVAEDMGTCEITKGKQALELRSNLSERRALTDRIKTTEGSDELSARNLQWSKAHILPESQHLRFDCGVLVQLGFAAEFSNILIIYTQIMKIPKDILSCEAKLVYMPEDLEVDLKFTNKESPEETGSVVFSAQANGIPGCCLYTRIQGLQKLKTELAFTVCLQYRYQGIDDFIEEYLPVNIGKPLVAKLNLQAGTRSVDLSCAHAPVRSQSSSQASDLSSCHSSVEPSFAPTPHFSSVTDCGDVTPSTYCLSGPLELYGTGPPGVNIPEENQSPDSEDPPLM
ncbi:mucosa-associated lymphoid tissue lymphoma translocation protein 1-like isoform X2 [Ambystoma mexicanum]|uniref:mucosa-associated lymphoid tissue lymphoma translocation protein 1-like isoform X2 n=1 Tax=Ambystoma mexicanum TaxID=8296 RepID=UPI0037E862C1